MAKIRRKLKAKQAESVKRYVKGFTDQAKRPKHSCQVLYGQKRQRFIRERVTPKVPNPKYNTGSFFGRRKPKIFQLLFQEPFLFGAIQWREKDGDEKTVGERWNAFLQ